MLATWLLAVSYALAADVSPVTSALLDLVGPKRATALRQPPELEPVALALRLEERPAAKAVLARLETSGDAGLRPDIARAYLLIGDPASAARLQPSLSVSDAEVQRALALSRNGDYEAAYTEATALDQKYPGRSDIASLLAATRGRTSGATAPSRTPVARTSLAPAAVSATPTEAKGITFTEAPRRRAFADAPPDINQSANVPGESERRGDGRVPLWPLLPVSLLSAGGYTVARRRKTYESGDEPETAAPLTEDERFIRGAVIAGIVGGTLYLALARAAVVAIPVIVRALNGGGQQLVQIAGSRTGAINPSGILRVGQSTLTLSEHAVQQMARRQLTVAQVEAALSNPTTFEYFHEGVRKIGYYDPATRIFLAQYQGAVFTVINNVKPQYIDNLKNLKP